MRLAADESQSSIAKEMGMCTPYHDKPLFPKRGCPEAYIENEPLNPLKVVPDAVENIKTLVLEMKSIAENDHKRWELSYKANQKALESAGIINTQTASQTLANISRRKRTYPPIIQELIKKHFDDMMDISPAPDNCTAK